MGKKEKYTERVSETQVDAQERDGQCDVNNSTQDYDEADEILCFKHCRYNRERGNFPENVLGYSNWCEEYSCYIEPIFNINIQPFIKGLKDISTNEPDIKDFYKFAYLNSSGYISPYL